MQSSIVRILGLTLGCALVALAPGCGESSTAPTSDGGIDAPPDAATSDGSTHDGGDADTYDGDVADGATADGDGPDGDVPLEPRLVPSVTSHDFGTLTPGFQVSLSLRFSNAGEGETGGLSVALEGAAGFRLHGDGCSGESLGAGESCEVPLLFSTNAEGVHEATLTVQGAKGGVVAVPVRATVARPARLVIENPDHDFGILTVGMTATHVVRVRNDGGQASAPITTALSGDATLTLVGNTCGGSALGPNATCVLAVRFAPIDEGASETTVTVRAASQTLSRHVAGFGVVAHGLSITPTSLDFPATALGEASAPATFTITNTGAETTEPLYADFAGSDGVAFTMVFDTCFDRALAPAESCTLTLRFTPHGTPGTREAVVFIQGAPDEVVVGRVRGEALPNAVLVPGGYTPGFGTITVGTVSPALSFSIRNAGTLPSGPIEVSLTGDTTEFEQTGNECVGPLAPGGTCLVSVRMKPTRFGAASASLTISGTPGGGFTYPLAGTGRDFIPLTVTQPFGGTGAGRVTGPGVNCPNATCTTQVARTSTDPTVTLTATAATSSTFTGWTGACADAGTSATCTLTLSDATTVGASFAIVMRTLTVTLQSVGGATGVIRSNAAHPYPRIECGDTCEITVPNGTSVYLFADPDEGSFPGGFSGGCVSDWLTCGVLLTEDKHVTAILTPANLVFTTPSTYSLAEVKAQATDDSTSAMQVLSGADALCQTLGGAPSFRAFIGAPGHNAIARFPAGARGFARADHRPFTTYLDPASSWLYHPALLDAAGTEVPTDVSAYIWTGVDVYGDAADGSTCNDWTEAGQVALARVGSTSSDWANHHTGACMPTTRHHLLCLDTRYAASVEPPEPPANARYAFVTYGTLDPSAGLAGADALCADEARYYLPGTYRAMLATSEASIASRFEHRSDPIHRPDYAFVAADSTALLTSGIDPLAPITIDPGFSRGDVAVFTGAVSGSAAGTPLTSCYDAARGSWSTTTATAARGASDSVRAWLRAGEQACASPGHVYCLQE